MTIICEFEHGKKTKQLRHVVMNAIIEKNNKILLVKRASELLEGNKYALPGGYLEKDETIEEGVLREIKEETGYQGEIDYLFKIIDTKRPKEKNRQNVAFIYVVTNIEKIGHKDQDIENVEWFSVDSLPIEDIAFDHYEEVLKPYLEKERLEKV
jgi:8-oxo-dGTP diphosphatase